MIGRPNSASPVQDYLAQKHKCILLLQGSKQIFAFILKEKLLPLVIFFLFKYILQQRDIHPPSGLIAAPWLMVFASNPALLAVVKNEHQHAKGQLLLGGNYYHFTCHSA